MLKRCSIIAVLLLSACTSITNEKPLQSYLENVPFEMGKIEAPIFPDKDFLITDFGAVGDGHTMNGDAISKTIAACTDAGGGRVIIPEGIWLTGPIQLQSNVNLHADQGALVLFSPKFEDYPLVRANWEGRPEVRCTSPINGTDLENIAITGKGVFDGSGDAWRPVKKFKLTEYQWQQLVASGGAVDEENNIWWPSREALNARVTLYNLNHNPNTKLEDYAAAREYLRPVFMSLVKCKNVLLDGPTFQNSPSWNLHPLMCENLIVRNVSVRNPWYSQNGDGIDIESCKNVLLVNSSFDVGDDAICIKSGRDKHGRERGLPTENLVVADCIVYHGHGGFTIGSEMSGGARNILVRNCTFIGTDVGLRFKSTRGRGGIVENIFIHDILMTDIPGEAIRFNMYYNGAAPLFEGEGNREAAKPETIPPVTEETPQFRKIYLNNIVCRGAGQAVMLQGLPEMAIREIEFENVEISANNGLASVDAENITLKNVAIWPEKGPAFLLYNNRDVVFEKPVTKSSVFLKLLGEKTGDISLVNVDDDLKGKVKVGKKVPSGAVK